MSEERLFKNKLFGGFNREDVMAYINELLAELKKCREENLAKDARITELEKLIDEYEAAAVNAVPAPPVEYDNPEDVLSHVDMILQNYLNQGE